MLLRNANERSSLVCQIARYPHFQVRKEPDTVGRIPRVFFLPFPVQNGHTCYLYSEHIHYIWEYELRLYTEKEELLLVGNKPAASILIRLPGNGDFPHSFLFCPAGVRVPLEYETKNRDWDPITKAEAHPVSIAYELSAKQVRLLYEITRSFRSGGEALPSVKQTCGLDVIHSNSPSSRL